jgi:hypothetical protein
MYFQADQDVDNTMDQVQQIHRLLLQWESQIPPELRATSFASHSVALEHDPIFRIFALQAFTLQAAYENMQLLLHRPFIPLPSKLQAQDPPDKGVKSSALVARHADEFITTSRNQCWISAMRMTDVDCVHGLLNILERTTPYTQWVSYAFNGGVMLAILALTSIGSNRTPLCKQALARLIKALQRGTTKLEMCEQVCRILTKLLHLIAAEEVKVMLNASTEGAVHEEDLIVPDYGYPKLREDVPHFRDQTRSIPSTRAISPARGTSPPVRTSHELNNDSDIMSWNGEFGLGGIGHLWMWNDSYSLLQQHSSSKDS